MHFLTWFLSVLPSLQWPSQSLLLVRPPVHLHGCLALPARQLLKIQLPRMRRLAWLIASVLAATGPVFTSPMVLGQNMNARPPRVDESNLPTTVKAEQMTGRPDQVLKLDNNVELTRGQTEVKADKATYRIIENEVEAHGCIRMNRYGSQYTGNDLQLNMDSGAGFLTKPTYKFGINGGHGVAERYDFEDEDHAKAIAGTYTTCPGTKPEWYIKSSIIDIDTGIDEGVARKGVLYFKSVPILASPNMSFPLSGDRQSGFLPPTIGATSKGGFEFSVPYYFNIAPNRDLTLTPNVITRRGLQLGAEGRYLGDDYNGVTRLEYLPDDALTKSNQYAIESTHTQILGSGFGMSWNVNYASDNKYPDDFSRSTTQSAQRLLNRELDLTYDGAYGSVTALASRYQVLQDFDANSSPLISRPYDRLPQVTYIVTRQDVGGFDWAMNAQYTRFKNSTYDVPISVQLPGEGDRIYINPQISYPIIGASYFLTPKLQFDVTSYSLTNVVPGSAKSFSRALPTFSLDAGLIFERNAKLFGNALTQTLEPRFFYVRTPHKDQNNYPLFETGVSDFNFAQIFTENSFAGHDRISDANQLTTAVTLRFIEESGIERLRLVIGQRFYFTPPILSLDSSVVKSRSDLLLAAGGQLSRTVGTDSNIQYSQSKSQLVRADYSVRWQPAPKQVFNLSYRLDRTPSTVVLNNNEILKQVDLSAQWPIVKRWYGVGRINYSLQDRKVAKGLLGLEYKADCWVFRVVAQQTPTSTAKAISALFFQLELNGLTKLGSNPLQALRSSIPGYQNIN
ncbi:MAG: LPS-assembly protein LptD [Glaciimonas sp.]|nr:LPS-assembly protein LptD [Glaciimonas sp.]